MKRYKMLGSIVFLSITISGLLIVRNLVNNQLNNVTNKTDYLRVNDIYDLCNLNMEDFAFNISMSDLQSNKQIVGFDQEIIDSLWQKIWKQNFSRCFDCKFLKKINQLINKWDIVSKISNYFLGHIYIDKKMLVRAGNNDVVSKSTLFVKVLGINDLKGEMVIPIRIL